MLILTKLAGYHYATDAVAFPNSLALSSSTSAEIASAWFRAWDVGRIPGPLCVNGTLIGYAVVAYRGTLSYSSRQEITCNEKRGRQRDSMCVTDMTNKAMFKEGFESAGFWYFVAASSVQITNLFYTLFWVFPLNDILLAEHRKISAKEKLNHGDVVREWVRQWKRMDKKRMILMQTTAALGLAGLWRTL